MATPEGMATRQALRSRRIAGAFFAAVLIAIGALAGIDLGIPIGREQQARLEAQRRENGQQDVPRREMQIPGRWPPAEDDGAVAGSLPAVPDIASLPVDLQQAFNRFYCDQVDAATQTQCLALAVLHADTRFEPGSASAPAVRPGGRAGTYREGQTMTLAARAGTDFDGYLYVDYFDREGNVIHLRPGLHSTGDALKAHDWIELGGRDYVACPPFGTDLVTAISTPLPLFARSRPIMERASDYLSDLHTQLQAMASADRGLRPTSGYGAVVTVARDGADL